MKLAFALIAILTLTVVLVPVANAQVATAASGGSGHNIVQCAERELSSISGVISASEVIACLSSPDIARSSTSVKGITWNVQGPDVPAGGTATFTPSTLSITGCTIGTWNTVTETLASGTGASASAYVTMTSNECTFFARMVVTAGISPVVLATFTFPVNIYVEHTSYDNDLSGGITVTDDANGWSNVVSGNLNVDMADDTVPDGALTTRTACDETQTSGPNLRYIDFGCWSAIISVPDVVTARNPDGEYVAHWSLICISDLAAYPSDNVCQNIRTSGLFQIPFETGSTCTNTVTGFPATHYTNTNDGVRYEQAATVGQITFTGSGCLAKLQVSPATTGSNVFEIPIVVRSELAQVDILDDTTNDNALSVLGNVLNGNVSSNTTNIIPATINVRLPGSRGDNGADFYLPIFLWIAGLLVFLRLGRLLAAGACTIGAFGALVIDSGPFQVVAFAILVVAVWLEAVAHDRIYQRFLNPNNRREPNP